MSPWVGVGATLALAAVAGWWSGRAPGSAAVLGVLAAIAMARPGPRKLVIGLALTGGALLGLCLVLSLIGIHEGPSSRSSRARLDLLNLQRALEVYQKRVGHYPGPELGFRELVQSGVLEREPLDPWETPYLYQLEDGLPVVRTLGADRSAGGTGEAADLSSLELSGDGEGH